MSEACGILMNVGCDDLSGLAMPSRDGGIGTRRLDVDVAAFVVSIAALLLAGASAAYTRQQAKATKDQARLSERQDHLARTPRLAITLPIPAGKAETSVTYVVHNDGPQDLDSVTVHRPEASDGGGVRYPVAPIGAEFGDQAELGPIRMGEAKSFVLSIGPSDGLPEFRVSVECRRGGDAPWRTTIKLDTARRYPQVF